MNADSFIKLSLCQSIYNCDRKSLNDFSSVFSNIMQTNNLIIWLIKTILCHKKITTFSICSMQIFEICIVFWKYVGSIMLKLRRYVDILCSFGTNPFCVRFCNIGWCCTECPQTDAVSTQYCQHLSKASGRCSHGRSRRIVWSAFWRPLRMVEASKPPTESAAPWNFWKFFKWS